MLNIFGTTTTLVWRDSIQLFTIAASRSAVSLLFLPSTTFTPIVSWPNSQIYWLLLQTLPFQDWQRLYKLTVCSSCWTVSVLWREEGYANRYTRLENLAWSHFVFWQFIFCRERRFMKPLLLSSVDIFFVHLPLKLECFTSTIPPTSIAG